MNNPTNDSEVNPTVPSEPTAGSDPVAPAAFDDAQQSGVPAGDVQLSEPAVAGTESSSATPTPVNTSGGGLGSAWVTLVIGAILLVLLLVFVLQNQDSLDVQFISWEFSMPAGVLILLAAIVGALVMALVAAMRIFQLRHRARRANKSMGTKKKGRKR